MIKHQYRMSDLHTIKDLTLSQPYGSEYLYGNTVNAVAYLLRGAAQRASSSEYFWDRRPTVVASLPRNPQNPRNLLNSRISGDKI